MREFSKLHAWGYHGGHSDIQERLLGPRRCRNVIEARIKIEPKPGVNAKTLSDTVVEEEELGEVPFLALG